MITVTIEPFELVALIDWHIDQKRESANKEEYSAADYHMKRAGELMKLREVAGKKV